jgi:hypothetical protein
METPMATNSEEEISKQIQKLFDAVPALSMIETRVFRFKSALCIGMVRHNAALSGCLRMGCGPLLVDIKSGFAEASSKLLRG